MTTTEAKKLNIEKRKWAIDKARDFAMSQHDRTNPEKHLLLGELVMFVHELYPDKS